MLHEDLIKFYSSIEIKVNPHVEAGESIPLYVAGLASDHLTAQRFLFSDIAPPETDLANAVVKNLGRCVDAETLVVASVVCEVNGSEKQFRIYASALWMVSADLILLKHAIVGSPFASPTSYESPIVPDVSECFDSITFRINPHKTTGLTIKDYIQDHDGKGFDDSYVCEDNYFSDDPNYDMEVGLCSAANRLYIATAYWKDDSGNQMCHDIFAHDYATILKELREIADDRNSNEEKV